jgi:hypothetical protein
MVVRMKSAGPLMPALAAATSWQLPVVGGPLIDADRGSGTDGLDDVLDEVPPADDADELSV